MRSGWDAKAGDEDAFLNADAGGTFHFPGFGADAAEYLLDRTKAAVIGVDTISLDPGNSTTFAVHVNWLGADHYGLEGLANLARSRRAGRRDRRRDPWSRAPAAPAAC